MPEEKDTHYKCKKCGSTDFTTIIGETLYHKIEEDKDNEEMFGREVSSDLDINSKCFKCDTVVYNVMFNYEQRK